MKFTVVLICLLGFSTISRAQWSNKTNYFADSLHMLVANPTSTQEHSFVVKSYPDGGYFIVWEDSRSSSTNGKDIYAQKYDKNGNALWAVNGVAVASGTNNQHIYSSTNADYRNYSYAATDSANGFYLGYIDDSISTYNWQRICVQHIRSNGTRVFGTTGFIVAQTPSGSNYNYGNQQLIADGNKGFYIGYLYIGNGVQDVYAYCYRDESGTMKFYGGGQMDVNAYEQEINTCGVNVIAYRDAYAYDYMIYPDLQNGCNIVMTLGQNSGGNDRYFTGFNRIVRVKKNSKVTDPNPPHSVYNYTKDNVMIYYQVAFRTYNYQCGDAIGTGYILDGNGYLAVTNVTYQSEYAKAVAVPTAGNININVMAYEQRNYNSTTNSPGNWYTTTLWRPDEKFDSIPYQYTVYPFKPESYAGIYAAPGQNKLNYESDTLLYNNFVYDNDFCLTAGGGKIYAAARVPNSAFNYDILLQQLQVKRITTDSFAVQFATGAGHHAGIKIGNNVSTGFSGSDVNLNSPQIAMDNNGNAMFYILEYGRSIRVSPIINATQLAWGAMGRRIGSGAYTAGYYYPDNPYVAYGATGTGVISWQDARNIPANTLENIYTRHLDSLTKTGYQPVYKKIKTIVYQGGQAYPLVLLGSSKQFSLIEYLNYVNGSFNDASPLVDILDNTNLGSVGVNVYQSINAIRTYNSKPYLDRDYTIKPSATVLAGTTVTLRFFFSTQDFTALKTAYPSITNPASLTIIKQPSTTNNAPNVYAPVTGEVKVKVQSWKAVSGGYYVQCNVTKFTGFTNYYIFPTAATPFKSLNLLGEWSNNASSLTWTNTDADDISGTETIERKYTADNDFTGIETRTLSSNNVASASTYTDATASGDKGSLQYRIRHVSDNGDTAYSNTITLLPGAQKVFIAKLYPTVVTNGRVYLQTGNETVKQMKVEIFRANGEPVYQQTLSYTSQWLPLRLPAPGVYKVRITAGALFYNGTFIWGNR